MRVLACAMGRCGGRRGRVDAPKSRDGGEVAKTLATFARDLIDHQLRLHPNTHATSLWSPTYRRGISDEESLLPHYSTSMAKFETEVSRIPEFRKRVPTVRVYHAWVFNGHVQTPEYLRGTSRVASGNLTIFSTQRQSNEFGLIARLYTITTQSGLPSPEDTISAMSISFPISSARQRNTQTVSSSNINAFLRVLHVCGQLNMSCVLIGSILSRGRLTYQL
jgi:hypothetical protein